MIGILLCSLYAAFLDPPRSAKPWTYYLWKNTHVDRELIAEDIADMSRMGFGGTKLKYTRIKCVHYYVRASLIAQLVKNPPAMQETLV